MGRGEKKGVNEWRGGEDEVKIDGVWKNYSSWGWSRLFPARNVKAPGFRVKTSVFYTKTKQDG